MAPVSVLCQTIRFQTYRTRRTQMPEFSFVAPILPGKTAAWRAAVAEIKGLRNAAYQESRRKLGIKQEHVSLQSYRCYSSYRKCNYT